MNQGTASPLYLYRAARFALLCELRHWRARKRVGSYSLDACRKGQRLVQRDLAALRAARRHPCGP